MANLATVIKDEIRRLAKKEAKEHTTSLKTASAQYRRDIAALKHTHAELVRRVAHLERAQTKGAATLGKVGRQRQVRFAPEWVVNHRLKVGLSQADYGRLLGVTGMTIYNWEAGNSRPKAQLLAKWGAVKKLGKREAGSELEAMR